MVEVFNCPCCCDRVFNSKESLIDHLSSYINISCPICRGNFTEVSLLIKHLYTCTPRSTESLVHVSHTNDFSYGSQYQIKHPDPVTSIEIDIENSIESNVNGDPLSFSEPPRVHLKTEISESPLVIPQLTIIHEDGVKKYVIVNQEVSKQKIISTEDNNYEDIGNNEQNDNLQAESFGGSESCSPNTQMENDLVESSQVSVYKEIGEKQYLMVKHASQLMMVNNENDEKMPSLVQDTEQNNLTEEPLISSDLESEDTNAEDLYSCNTCGVSFASVFDHIKNFHNDQDVVIEMNTENKEEMTESITDEILPTEKSPPQSFTIFATKKSQRVITETGDIVETTPLSGSKFMNKTKNEERLTMQMVEENCVKIEELTDNQGRSYIRKLVDLGRTCTDSTIVYKEVFCIPIDAVIFTCNVCSKTFNNGKSLSAHMKVHIIKKETKVVKLDPLDRDKHVCSVCNTVFPTNKSLRLHVRMHEPVKSRPIEPPAHSPTDEVTTYLCKDCNKHIPLEYQVVHQKYHLDTSNHHCDICNRKYPTQEHLDMHMVVHNVEKPSAPTQKKARPYTCAYCPRQFFRPHEKVKHERIHTGEKPHCCEICGKSFRVSYCLTLHMRTHTGDRPYECQHCGKRFKAHSVFNHHLLTHSDVRAYKCPFCPKSFKTSVQLAGHKKSHTKPFTCNVCNRPFASLYAVRIHTETHQKSNNLKYSCMVCGAIYARTFALKDHIRQAHPDADTQNIDSLISTEFDGVTKNDTTLSLAERLNIKVPKILNTYERKQVDS